MALQRLKEAAEKAKIELSSDAADRDQPALHHRRRHRAEAPGTIKLTPANLEQLVGDLWNGRSGRAGRSRMHVLRCRPDR